RRRHTGWRQCYDDESSYRGLEAACVSSSLVTAPIWHVDKLEAIHMPLGRGEIVGQGAMPNFQLAEQLFLIGHDNVSGRPVVSIELIECGLVGALFGELIIDGRLSIQDGLVVVLDREPIDGGLADRLVDTIDRQS